MRLSLHSLTGYYLKMRWPFSRTYKVRCPDGSEKVVYKNIDDAFPLFLPGFKASLDGGTKIPATANAEIRAVYESKIQGLLFGLEELNQDLMMKFRSAYVVYQSDPCGGHHFLQRQIELILHEQSRFKRVRLQIDGLIALVKSSKSVGDCMPIFQDIVQQVGGGTVREAIVMEIKDATSVAKKWIGKPNAS
jgi:hypothetical protein